MGTDSRQSAYEHLIVLANKQGYVTFDDIMDCADKYSLPIQDFDWLSNSITTRGILVYSDAPTHASQSDDEEYDDFAQSDYDAVYDRIITLCPSLGSFVSAIKSIPPPQRGEIKQLKYQIVDGNTYARNRMIEMHLRLALRIALQRAETYEMDIEDAIGYACLGLITAVDKFDPDSSGAFASYAVLWILQNISREQPTLRPLIYLPSHLKEHYFTMLPILKSHGCIGCENLLQCNEALQMVTKRINCSEKDATRILKQMIPDEQLDTLLEVYTNEVCEYTSMDPNVAETLRHLSTESILDDESMSLSAQNKMLKEELIVVLSTLSPREEKILRLRYGFDGREKTLEEIGAELHVTRERIRQIELRALRKLRHPSRAHRLMRFLG